MSILAINPTNDFNALGIITPKTLNRLMMLALNGDSIVNPLGEAANRDERTPQGRACKEREEQDKRYFQMAMAQLEERRVAFQRELDRVEQASMEALHENEEQQRIAGEELRKIQERAYEITLADGTVSKVYRDGDKVRTDAGAEVGRDVLKAEDVPDGLPQWAERRAAGERIEALDKEHREILEYREKLEHAREQSRREDIAPETLDKIKAGVENMPDSVRAHYESPEAALPSRKQGADDSFERRASSMRAFSAAAAERAGTPADDAAPEVRTRQQADVSVPAPK